MKQILILILLLTLTFAQDATAPQDAAATIEVKDNVLILTEATFQEALSTYPHLLVEFFAPWCGHCKQLAPEYAKAATILKGMNSKAAMASVDCTVQKNLCQKYEVKGYPTLKFFQGDSEPKLYKSGRKTVDLVNYLKEVAEFSPDEEVKQDDSKKQEDL